MFVYILLHDYLPDLCWENLFNNLERIEAIYYSFDGQGSIKACLREDTKSFGCPKTSGSHYTE